MKKIIDENIFRSIKFLAIKQHLDIFIILFIAAFIRLYGIRDYMEFLGDEGRDVLVVYNILHGHLTLLGPLNAGLFSLGPVYYYFMTPFILLFNFDPVGPAVMVAIFGIATVWLIYKVGSEFISKKAGIIAALLYAISPLMIIYSSSSWNPWPLPFFSLSALYILYKGQIKNKLSLLFLSGLLLGVAMQLHYTALFLTAIVFVYVFITDLFVLGKAKIIKRLLLKYMVIVLGCVSTWFPFLLYEISSGYPNIKAIFNFILHSGSGGSDLGFFLRIYSVFFNIYGRYVFGRFSFLDNFFAESNSLAILSYFFILAIASISLFLLVTKLYKSLSKKNEKFYQYSLLFLWLILGVGFFGFYKESFLDHHYAFLFPLTYLLVALLINNIYEFRIKNFPNNMLKATSILIFLTILILNLNNLHLKYEHPNQVGQAEAVSKFVLVQARGKPFNFALVTNPPNYEETHLYFFTIWNHSPLIIEDQQRDPQRRTITNQLFVVCEIFSCSPLESSLPEVKNFGKAEISNRWNISGFEIYKLIHL